jgi:thioredoxin
MNITDQNYKDVIENNLVAVKFGAEWCGPCKVVDPIFKKLETEDLGVVVGLCDVDTNSEASTAFGVRNLPTMLFFKNGIVVDKHVGVITETQLRAKIENLKLN